MGYEIIIQALWLVLPAYIANASALLVGGGTPIDFGKNWKDGKRILGDGKTWRGLVSGAFVGMTCGFGFSVVAKYTAVSDFSFLGINDFTGFPLMIPIIASLCFGALIGDIVESFFKRRLGKNRGEDWIPFDQLDFIIGALLLSFFTASILQIVGLSNTNWFFDSFTIWHILVLFILTPFFHLFANLVNKKVISKNHNKKTI
jgi:CDP-2,3-bis-(O-geranylgeranyl)-sn-glycerol synthase